MRLGRLGRDGIGGLVVFAGSLVLIWMTLGLKDSPMVPIGPGFYPRIVLGLTAVLGFAMFVNDWLDRRKAVPAAPAEPAKPREGPGLNYKLVAIMFAEFAVYVLCLQFIGFRIATFAYVAATNALLSPPTKPAHWVRVLILALATAFLTHLLFERYLSVLLPRGRWTGY